MSEKRNLPQLEPVVDLNQLFNMQYGFDALKSVISQLLSNQGCLQDQINELFDLNAGY
jgi:hypothetical protein